MTKAYELWYNDYIMRKDSTMYLRVARAAFRSGLKSDYMIGKEAIKRANICGIEGTIYQRMIISDIMEALNEERLSSSRLGCSSPDEM